ncbi:MAG: DUF6066 family protein [Myxococcota bacterium]
MTRLALSLGLLTLLATDAFDAAKAKATEVESLQKLLDAYTAPCHATDPLEQQDCDKRAKTAQAAFKGKTLYLNLGNVGLERLLEPLDASPGKGAVLITPIFDGGSGVALTFAKPQKLDKDGNVVVSRVPVEGTLSDDTLMASDVKRLVRTGQLGLEIIFTVKGPWEIKRKGGEPVRGLEISPSAFRFSNRRTGKPLFSHVK